MYIKQVPKPLCGFVVILAVVPVISVHCVAWKFWNA